MDAGETIKKILIVDDDPHIVRMLQTCLERETFEVLTAGTGADGLACATAQQPDLIVLDVMMPKMDGFETLRKLKADATTDKIPVIMLTAKVQDADVLNGWKTGVHLYLTKPLEPVVLIKHVKCILQSHDIEDTYLIYSH